MTALSPEELEGRLNAHRELMISWLAAMMGGEETTRALLQRLSEDATFKDHEEDPGIAPGEGFAIETATARESRTILEAARARMKAEQRTRETG
ncbi:hypothetical protein ACQKKX_00225 [Neorhizobium sp. NPDC001467]|uniref:hypothetical protein n=1 Tax=Neorhizobium sp. NPDC001467 TaxID=3390595 RepID=UPI003D037405